VFVPDVEEVVEEVKPIEDIDTSFYKAKSKKFDLQAKI